MREDAATHVDARSARRARVGANARAVVENDAGRARGGDTGGDTARGVASRRIDWRRSETNRIEFN